MPADETLVANASRALSQLLDVRAGENVLVVTDEATLRVAEAFEEGARRAGAKPQVYVLPEGSRPLRQVPEDLAALVPDTDVAVTCFQGRAEETPFRIELIRSLMRVARRLGHAPGITESMLREGPMDVDHDAMRAEALDLMNRFEGATRVRVTAPGGTDVTLDLTGRAFSTDTFLQDGHWGNLPAGEVWCAPIEDSADGVVACDGSIGDLGPVPTPVRLTLERGRVTRVECADEAFRRRVEDVLAQDDEARVIGELGIGLNPRARLTGNLLEDEKARHTAHIAFGNNEDMPGGRNRSRTHRDFLFRSPTFEVTFVGGRVETVTMGAGAGGGAGHEEGDVTERSLSDPGSLQTYRNILVAVDFSEASRTALRVAHASARRNGAQLTVCHVISRPVAVSPLFPHYVAMPDPEAIRRQEDDIRANLAEVIRSETGREPDGSGGDGVRVVVASGAPAAEVVRLAEELGVDLVVVASRGLSGIARMVLGSVAESVARHAHCHVLVTR